MGFDLGKFVRNVASAGSTYFRDQRQAKEDKQDANDLIAENTDLAQQLFDEDLGSTALANLAADPALRQRQQETLDRFGDMSRDGWTSLDRQALDAQNFQSRQEEASQRAGVLDDAARRGDVSGGNTLLASLMAQQGSSNRASQRDTGLALEGRQRALDAIANQGQLAGQMRGQQFSEDAARGSAMDQFRQWAAGERSGRAGMLMNARTGQSTNMMQQANELASSDTAAAIANGALNVYTGGLSGAATGAVTNNVAAPGAGDAKSMPGAPQQKGMAPQRTTTFGGAPRPTLPSSGRAMAGGSDPRSAALSQLAGTGGVQPQQRRPRRPGMGV